MTSTTYGTWRDPALGTRREIDLPAARLPVFETGDGAPVVFVHGLLVNANLWAGVVPLVAPGHRCVTVDLPFGSHTVAAPDADLTPPGLAALLIGVIEDLGLGPVTLVGNDSGGAVCQIAAVTRPDLVARLVLTSCDSHDRFPPKAFAFLRAAAAVPGALAALAGTLRVRALRRMPLAYGWLTSVPLSPEVGDSFVTPARVDPAVRADLRRVLRGLHPRHTRAAAARFKDFDRPVLIAWSEKDRFFPARDAERLAGDFPDARLTWIAGARTFSPVDRPGPLAAAITGFLDRTAAEVR
ncbi:alpha/beta fold hydrolase [Actinomadura rayongensis]|uniref:Alpha/beta fold hydrolase n=1 Tax=Actinomadura rayongensis TaxID=1429076 RepID=A0A6I4WCC3_9ACTN|nr:alpha/beta hydrolase [Actinomadura rayongensis]MXQ65875.1 alpha/beta fold hydrolase [Actinomadura rayongensis]